MPGRRIPSIAIYGNPRSFWSSIWFAITLAKAGLTTVAVFTFINIWNDFMRPLLYLFKNPDNRAAALRLALFRRAFIGRLRWDLIKAGSTAMIVPVILVFFMAQRFFVQGFAVFGIKG